MTRQWFKVGLGIGLGVFTAWFIDDLTRELAALFEKYAVGKADEGDDGFMGQVGRQIKNLYPEAVQKKKEEKPKNRIGF